jgi:Family of unknown function (DUF5985)
VATAVYVGCAMASLACALLLLAAYRRQRARLLLWSCVCFAWLAVNNVLLVVDLVLVDDVDLSIARVGSALIGLVTLLYGLIYDSQRGAGA